MPLRETRYEYGKQPFAYQHEPHDSAFPSSTGSYQQTPFQGHQPPPERLHSPLSEDPNAFSQRYHQMNNRAGANQTADNIRQEYSPRQNDRSSSSLSNYTHTDDIRKMFSKVEEAKGIIPPH